MNGHADEPLIDLLFVVPPQSLLLDVAGPAEALRQANRYQREVRFDLSFTGPCAARGA